MNNILTNWNKNTKTYTWMIQSNDYVHWVRITFDGRGNMERLSLPEMMNNPRAIIALEHVMGEVKEMLTFGIKDFLKAHK